MYIYICLFGLIVSYMFYQVIMEIKIGYKICLMYCYCFMYVMFLLYVVYKGEVLIIYEG